jgi:hypothetical protein
MNKDQSKKDSRTIVETKNIQLTSIFYSDGTIETNIKNEGFNAFEKIGVLYTELHEFQNMTKN